MKKVDFFDSSDFIHFLILREYLLRSCKVVLLVESSGLDVVDLEERIAKDSDVVLVEIDELSCVEILLDKTFVFHILFVFLIESLTIQLFVFFILHYPEITFVYLLHLFKDVAGLFSRLGMVQHFFDR